MNTLNPTLILNVNPYLLISFTVVMVELDPKAALKSFNPASVMPDRPVFVHESSTQRLKWNAVTHRQHPSFVGIQYT